MLLESVACEAAKTVPEVTHFVQQTLLWTQIAAKPPDDPSVTPPSSSSEASAPGPTAPAATAPDAPASSGGSNGPPSPPAPSDPPPIGATPAPTSAAADPPDAAPRPHRPQDPLKPVILSCMRYLQRAGFVDFVEGAFVATLFGLAAYKSSMPVEHAVAVSVTLNHAREAMCLSDDLHACFLTAPLESPVIPDWSFYHRLVGQLPPIRQRIANFVGVSELYLCRRAQGLSSAQAAAAATGAPGPPPTPRPATAGPLGRPAHPAQLPPARPAPSPSMPPPAPSPSALSNSSILADLPPGDLVALGPFLAAQSPNPAAAAAGGPRKGGPDGALESPFQHADSTVLLGPEAVAMRFYSALIMSELIQEKDIVAVADKYHVNRGHLQVPIALPPLSSRPPPGLMANGAVFAQMMAAFCRRMEWPDMEVVLQLFCKRLNHGVRTELIPLIEIGGVGQARARALWNAGYRDVRSLALAQPEDVVAVVRGGMGHYPLGTVRRIIESAQSRVNPFAHPIFDLCPKIHHALPGMGWGVNASMSTVLAQKAEEARTEAEALKADHDRATATATARRQQPGPPTRGAASPPSPPGRLADIKSPAFADRPRTPPSGPTEAAIGEGEASGGAGGGEGPTPEEEPPWEGEGAPEGDDDPEMLEQERIARQHEDFLRRLEERATQEQQQQPPAPDPLQAQGPAGGPQEDAGGGRQ
ncbi:hypothetical protein PAPYR_5309 [Paratrimastix pyriformis]|uniref:POLQ-like helical domain-containing protein n=1 Tax=Paratrimastix pyriformis TaxID=342808 RepID=A0ABQ8UK48_9EUKA|nr:hypothetical protein PAPYR_5309 [Paratrimastix pyriformis]